jgi:putative isomerase
VTAVAPDRHWNTWDARYAGAFVHLPTGLTLRLSAFAGGTGAWTDFPYGADVRLGPHLADGSFVEAELPHAGARLRLRFAKPSPGTVVGEVRVLELAGWGLRFWLLLDVGFPGGGGTVRLEVPDGPRRYLDPPVATIEAGSFRGAFSTAAMPVGAHLYADRIDARGELEAGGYYARPLGRDEGGWAQFRFAATEPRFVFALRLGGPGDAGAGRDAGAGLVDALERADAALSAARAAATAETSPGRAAVRDVVAWNTVWDPFHLRPYTVATRAWAPEKFGGWFVWLSDAFYAAILAAHAGDADTARANVEAALSNAAPDGTLAGLMSGRTAWVDRSQLPVGAHATWLVHRLIGDRDVLERAYPILRSAFWRWFETRDGNGNGLLEPGSSPVGDGHFVHTKQAALDEAAMDNSAVYDEASFDPDAHTLDCEDVALNGQLVLEGETLARIGETIGRPQAETDALRARARSSGALVRDVLWDPARRIFANRLWDGRFVRSVGPSSFYPMMAGIATAEQADALVRDHLVNPEEFWGEHPVAGTPFDDPAAADDVYWRGRVWPTMNYLVWLGLVRYGYASEAAELARRSRLMFERGWAERRCYENLSQRTGDGGGSPDSDPFYTWGALLALIGDERVAEAFLHGIGG